LNGKTAVNDNSIAFALQYRSFRMLFSRDAGVAAERRFLDERIDVPIRIPDMQLSPSALTACISRN
jgi:hypothetical protein